MAEEVTRVLVVDDHGMVRVGILAYLAVFEDIEVVGEAESGSEAVEKARELSPDVVLMDLVMREMGGVEATRRIRAATPRARVLVLTSYCTDDLIFAALRAGAVGYLLKDSDPQDLVRAIREAHRGESSLAPTVAQKVLRGLSDGPRGRTEPDALTERELEVLKLLARGHSDVQIGRALHVSPATVRSHVSNILARLDLTNRVQAARYAFRHGLATLEEGA
jgi:NarL family two-component system response regulator LiaR